MCDKCDHDENHFDLFDMEGSEDMSSSDLENARAFFMAMLEESEPMALARYQKAEATFKASLAKLKALRDNDGEISRELLTSSKEAYDEVVAARDGLESGLQRTAYKMTHTALA